jgi:hypothetical protein
MSKVLSAHFFGKLLNEERRVHNRAAPGELLHPVCSIDRTLSHFVERWLRNALLSAQPHVRLPLAQAAFPRKQTEQRQDGALKHTLPRKPPILSMTTGGTRPHENLDGLKAG